MTAKERIESQIAHLEQTVEEKEFHFKAGKFLSDALWIKGYTDSAFDNGLIDEETHRELIITLMAIANAVVWIAEEL